MISNLRRRKSKKGAWWASLSLEDMAGQIEILVFPKAYETCQNMLEDDRATLITGKYDIDEERRRIMADTVCPLDELRERGADAVQLRLDAATLDDDLLDRLRETLENHAGDTKLFLEVARPGSFRLVALAESRYRVSPSSALTKELESLLGPDRVFYRASVAT